MQQTEKYQLNLIETSDVFSPAPLNENMEKVEAQFDAVRAEAADAAAALDARVQVFEAHKFALAYYVGTGTSSQIIELGFTPTMVLTTRGLSLPESPLSSIKIVPGGFQAYLQTSGGGVTSSSANTNGVKYNYLAFA